jgi:hypothetical protein
MPKNTPLTYQKLNPFEYIVKPTYTIDEFLLLIGDDTDECKPYEWCDDPAEYVREIRSNKWNRCDKKGMQ